MKKIVLLVLVVSLSFAGAFSKKAFKRTIRHVPVNKMLKTSKALQKSTHLSNIVKKISLKRMQKIDKLAIVAENIAKKSPIHNRLMSSSYPLGAMRLYAKGGDKLFKNIGILSQKAMSVDMKTLSYLNSKLSNFPKIPKMTQKQILDKTIQVAIATGKFGIKVINELAKLATKYPKSAFIGALYGWFISDPESFKVTLDEFGGSVEEFVSYLAKTAGKTTGRVVSGTTDGFFESLKENITSQSVYILVGLLLAYIAFKFRNILFNFIQTSKKVSDGELSEQLTRKKRKNGRY